MAANPETATPQREGRLKWKCECKIRKREHDLGEHMYLVKCNGETLLYCEKCAKEATADDLSKYRAKEFEELWRNLDTNLEKQFILCDLCQQNNTQKPVSHKHINASGSRSSKLCKQHAKEKQDAEGGKIKELKEHQRVVEVKAFSLLTHEIKSESRTDSFGVVSSDTLGQFNLDLTRLAVPDVEDEKNGPALLLKRVLDKEIANYKAKPDRNNAPLTNAFHFFTLLNTLFKLNVLIRHPQKGGVLKDYRTRGGSALSTTEFNIDRRQFTVGKGHCVIITVPEDPANCEPYLSAPGFHVTVYEPKREDYQLKVNFDLEMDEWTKMAASAGDARGEFMIGYINTKTQNGLFTQAVASSQYETEDAASHN